MKVGNTDMLVPLVPIFLILFAGVACYNHWYFFHDEGPPPDRGPNQPVEMMDMETYETMTLRLYQWQALGQKGGKYRNPNRGTYSMVARMTCAFCKKKIPGPAVDPALLADAQCKIRDAYLCPFCKKPAYGWSSPPPSRKPTRPAPPRATEEKGGKARSATQEKTPEKVKP